VRTVNPQKVENRKNQILDAARHCFEQKGFHATTMAEICARAQISPGALYRYYASKESIIDAICEDQQFRSISILRTKSKLVKTITEFEMAMDNIVTDIIENYCNKEHGAMAAELIAEAMRNDGFSKNAAQSYISYQNEFAAFLKIGQNIGAIDATLDAKEAAGMLMAMVDGLVLRIAFCNDLDNKKIKQWLLNLAYRYLRNSKSTQINPNNPLKLTKNPIMALGDK
jgi:TetR/AcrR family transcriptional regulator, repressor for uid operon